VETNTQPKDRQKEIKMSQRIGHPLLQQNITPPAIFDAPTKENYHNGFVQCLVTRVGNLYHFSHQVGGTEEVSMIGSKLSKIILLGLFFPS
jgi:hypothetical protein